MTVEQWLSFTPLLKALPVDLTDERESKPGKRFWPNVLAYFGKLYFEGLNEELANWFGNIVEFNRYDVRFPSYEYGNPSSSSLCSGHYIVISNNSGGKIIAAKTAQLTSKSSIFSCCASDMAYADVIRLAYKLALE